MKNEKKNMKDYFDETIREYYEEQVGLINEMMKPEVCSFSEEEETCIFAFPIQKWQTNRVGKMHGGAICTAFDTSISALARFLSNSYFTPTMDLNVRFMRPIEVGDTLLVKVQSPYCGRKISHYEALAYSKNTGKSIASATSSYMHVEK